MHNQIPRRNRVDLMTPAELAIRAAVAAVEEAGCDVRLTDAVNLLEAAREKVADFVDGVSLPPPRMATIVRVTFNAGPMARRRSASSVASSKCN